MSRKKEFKYFYDLVDKLNKYIHYNPLQKLKPIKKRIKQIRGDYYGKYFLLHPINPNLLRIYINKSINGVKYKIIYYITPNYLEKIIEEVKEMDKKLENLSKEIQEIIKNEIKGGEEDGKDNEN